MRSFILSPVPQYPNQMTECFPDPSPKTPTNQLRHGLSHSERSNLEIFKLEHILRSDRVTEMDRVDRIPKTHSGNFNDSLAF